jgi:hypothetical protein
MDKVQKPSSPEYKKKFNAEYFYVAQGISLIISIYAHSMLLGTRFIFIIFKNIPIHFCVYIDRTPSYI